MHDCLILEISGALTALSSTVKREIPARTRHLIERHSDVSRKVFWVTDDKERLLEALIDEVEGPADPDVDRAWLEEVQKRSQELDDGAVSAVSREDTIANVRSGLRKIRKT